MESTYGHSIAFKMYTLVFNNTDKLLIVLKPSLKSSLKCVYNAMSIN